VDPGGKPFLTTKDSTGSCTQIGGKAWNRIGLWLEEIDTLNSKRDKLVNECPKVCQLMEKVGYLEEQFYSSLQLSLSVSECTEISLKYFKSQKIGGTGNEAGRALGRG